MKNITAFTDVISNNKEKESEEIKTMVSRAKSAVAFVEEHVDRSTRLIYENLKIFSDLFSFLTDNYKNDLLANSKYLCQAALEIARGFAAETELDMTEYLWDEELLSKGKDILKKMKIDNLKAYIILAKERYLTTMDTPPERLEFTVQKNTNGTFTARYLDLCWEATDKTEEEAVGRLIESYADCSEKEEYIWARINQDYDDKRDYISLLKDMLE